MSNFNKDSKALLEAIGGAKNISAVSHCATRMRFVLIDPKKANESIIENIPSVKGMFTQAGQFQVIIGNNVSTFFNEFSKVSGISGVSKEQAKSAAKQNQNIAQRLVGILAEVFSPIIPAVVVGGLLLGFRNILEGIQFSGLNGQTIVEVSQFWNGVNSFLWLICEAIFHFLPIAITWSIAKKMGTTQVLGIVLGITLVSPQLLNAYSVATTAADKIPFWDFGYFQVDMIGYQAQVIPAMMAGFLLAYLEIYFRKIIPEAVSMIFVPLFSLVPTVIAAHVILGPIGWKIGAAVSAFVTYGLASSLNWLFGGLFGFLYAPLVITGLHHMLLAIDLQLLADYGGTNFWPMVALSNIAQGSAVLAIIYLHRGNKEEEQISIPATISCYLGVTEPAMFGINLKYLFPFIAGMIGSGVAGLLSTLFGVTANGVGVGGLPAILSIKPEYWVQYALCMIIAIIIPFILTVIFERRGILTKSEDLDTPVLSTETVTPNPISNTHNAEENMVPFKLASPATGQLIPITKVNDSVFSQKMMGDGYAIRPTNGQIKSPADGIISSIFPTKHALGLTLENGIELLIHLGLDTVELKGEGFTVLVKEGDSVSRGQSLINMDLNILKQHNKESDVIIILTNLNEQQVFTLLELDNVDSGEIVGKVN